MAKSIVPMTTSLKKKLLLDVLPSHLLFKSRSHENKINYYKSKTKYNIAFQKKKHLSIVHNNALLWLIEKNSYSQTE